MAFLPNNENKELQELLEEKQHLTQVLASLRHSKASANSLIAYIRSGKEPSRAQNEWLSASIREGAVMAVLLIVVLIALIIIFFVQLTVYISWNPGHTDACGRLQHLLLAALILKGLVFGATLLAACAPYRLEMCVTGHLSLCANPFFALIFLTYLSFALVLLWALALTNDVCVDSDFARRLLWPSALLPVSVAGMPFLYLYCKRRLYASRSNLKAMQIRSLEIEEHLKNLEYDAPHTILLVGLPGSLLLLDVIRKEAEAMGFLNAWVSAGPNQALRVLEQIFPVSLAALVDLYRGSKSEVVEVEVRAGWISDFDFQQRRSRRPLRFSSVPGIHYDDSSSLLAMSPRKWWQRVDSSAFACVVCSLQDTDYYHRATALRVATVRLSTLAGLNPRLLILVLDMPEREIKRRYQQCRAQRRSDHSVCCECEFCAFARVEDCWVFEETESGAIPGPSPSDSSSVSHKWLLNFDRLVSNLEGAQLSCWIVCMDLKNKTGGQEFCQLLTDITYFR